MKKLRLIYFPDAQRDLMEIAEYIRVENPSAAQRFIHDFDRSLRRLESFPLSGAVPRDEVLEKSGYRIVVFGNYLAFYRVDRSFIKVMRVIHGRRDYAFLL